MISPGISPWPQLKLRSWGKDDFTDVLTLSFSSTDKVGHNFGVNSKEVQDTYLRLDRSIAKLLRSLNESIGKGNDTLFLTADHGAGDVPSYLESLKIPAGYTDTSILTAKLEDFLKEEFQREDLIEMVFGPVYLNHEAIRKCRFNPGARGATNCGFPVEPGYDQ